MNLHFLILFFIFFSFSCNQPINEKQNLVAEKAKKKLFYEKFKNTFFQSSVDSIPMKREVLDSLAWVPTGDCYAHQLPHIFENRFVVYVIKRRPFPKQLKYVFLVWDVQEMKMTDTLSYEIPDPEKTCPSNCRYLEFIPRIDVNVKNYKEKYRLYLFDFKKEGNSTYVHKTHILSIRENGRFSRDWFSQNETDAQTVYTEIQKLQQKK